MSGFVFSNNINLGFGFLRLPRLNGEYGNVDYEKVNVLVDKFISCGNNYFETAFRYHLSNSETAIRKCLVERYPRNSFVLCDKMPIVEVTRTEQYNEIFHEQLVKCGVDYFDVYLLHDIGDERYQNTEALGGFQFLKSLKENGLAKYIGFSFHDTADVLRKVLKKHREGLDVIQLQLNYFDWNSSIIHAEECYKIAREYELPIFVMEPVKGGRLAKIPEEAQELLEKADPRFSPSQWALRFVASHEGVKMILSGMNTERQIQENTDCLTPLKKLTKKEFCMLEEVRKIISKTKMIQCTECRYCVDVCPKCIPIPELLSILNNNEFPFQYERACHGKGKGSDCIECGQCEKICSQHLEIIKYIRTVAEKYENKI